jgi:hypothetical protein
MLDKNVLEALRNGRNLCDQCYGRKYLENIAAPDFPGDKDYRWIKCSKCNGTGLEKE